MKQLTALQQARRSNTSRVISPPLDNVVEGAIKSPATIFWLVLHVLCCFISLVLGFRFSRLVFFILVSSNSSATTTVYSNLQTLSLSPGAPPPPPLGTNTTVSLGASRIMVGRHLILIRPWPHPDPVEVMKAHRIMEQIQIEQRSQYGIQKPRTVIAVTPTYVRTFQTLHLTGIMHSLMNVPYDLVWIVVEAGGISNETSSLISKSGLNTIHIGFDERMPLLWEDRHKHESRMRLQALRIIREKRLDGIIVFIDDSNMHSLEFFDEIQSLKRIGAVSLGVLPFSGEFNDRELSKFEEHSSKQNNEERSIFHVQGPACNSSNHFLKWNSLNVERYANRSAMYVGDQGIVLPRKMEWAGFVINSRLLWEEKSVWVKDWEDLDIPMYFLKDSSLVEPLGDCGRKVLIWWLRVEARADSKFPPGWIIESQLPITVAAKRTPWPELPFSSEKEIKTERSNKEIIPEKHTRRNRRSRKKHISSRHAGDN